MVVIKGSFLPYKKLYMYFKNILRIYLTLYFIKFHIFLYQCVIYPNYVLNSIACVCLSLRVINIFVYVLYQVYVLLLVIPVFFEHLRNLINVKQIKWSRKIQSYSLNKLHSNLYYFPLSSIRRLKPYCKLSCLMTPGEPIALHATFSNCDNINSGGDRGRYLAFFLSLLPRSARKK